MTVNRFLFLKQTSRMTHPVVIKNVTLFQNQNNWNLRQANNTKKVSEITNTGLKIPQRIIKICIDSNKTSNSSSRKYWMIVIIGRLNIWWFQIEGGQKYAAMLHSKIE